VISIHISNTHFVCRPEHSKNCSVCMTDLLQQIVEECSSLPVEAIDILVDQFSPKRQKENPAAFTMAVDLCKNAADQLQRYFCTVCNLDRAAPMLLLITFVLLKALFGHDLVGQGRREQRRGTAPARSDHRDQQVCPIRARPRDSRARERIAGENYWTSEAISSFSNYF
jgi:hypothetical protein